MYSTLSMLGRALHLSQKNLLVSLLCIFYVHNVGSRYRYLLYLGKSHNA